MENLVQVAEGQVVVSSRQIAEHFEKRHADVLAGIENIKTENSVVTPMFCETTYTAGTGKAYKEYLMNRDGFSLLVMGFTGKKAFEWKIKYIQAFNAIEDARASVRPCRSRLQSASMDGTTTSCRAMTLPHSSAITQVSRLLRAACFSLLRADCTRYAHISKRRCLLCSAARVPWMCPF